MLNYDGLIGRLDRQIATILPQQVIDQSHSDCGGFVSDGMAGPSNVSSVTSLGYAYLLEGSQYYQSQEILERILMGAKFGRNARRVSGRFDLISTNFDSSPDTAFLVKALSPLVKAAQKKSVSGDSGAEEIAASLGEIIQTGAPGIVSGGFHTPNHRWVIVAALSQAQELFPELELLETVESYLSETIDINSDGEYTERSTAVYNAICNRSLRIASESLRRPELLEPVRKNLDLSYHLLHADGSVVTSISSRQDQGKKVVPVDLADSYYALARMEQNGFYAAVADWLFDLSQGGVIWMLHPFLEHPEWREDDLKREQLVDSYSKVYSTSEIWRVRRGKMSATAVSGITAPFSLKYGQIELNAVKVCASYFGTSQFIGEIFMEKEGNVHLTHPGRGWNRLTGSLQARDKPGSEEQWLESPGYFYPLGKPVGLGKWREMKSQREFFSVPPMSMDLGIEEVVGGFNLRITTSKGLDRVPLQIECDFVPGGEVDFESGAIQGFEGGTVFLKSGYAIYHIGTDGISVGPGAYFHRMWQMRNSEPASEAFRILITLLTPVDRVLEVRCGTWSSAMEKILK